MERLSIAGGVDNMQPNSQISGRRVRFRVLRRERNSITALRIVPLPGEAEMSLRPRSAGPVFLLILAFNQDT